MRPDRNDTLLRKTAKTSAAWLLIAAVSSGVLAGGLVAWIATRPGDGPRQAADTAGTDGESLINLAPRHDRSTATNRAHHVRRGLAAPFAPQIPSAGSELRDAERSVSDPGEVSGEEASVATLPDDGVTDRGPQNEPEVAEVADHSWRRKQAFAAFQSMVEAVSLPMDVAASGADLGGPRPTQAGSDAEIDLGSFDLADLVAPKFRLAIPRDTVDEAEFKADIVKVAADGDPRWEVRYLPVATTLGGGASPAKPHPLAYVVAQKNRLVLEVPWSPELPLAPFALLRRSVLLVEAKDPAASEAPAVVREIRLVEPTTIRPLTIDLFAEDPQELQIKPPGGIPRRVSGPNGQATLKLPVKSVRFQADLPKGKKVTFELPKDVKEGTDPGIWSWGIPLVQLSKDLIIQATVELSLPQATMTVQTEIVGPRAKLCAKEDVKRFFIDKPDDVLRNLRRGFDSRVKTGAGFDFKDGKTRQGEIRKWFDAPLATQRKGGLGMAMSGHETVQESFGVFLTQKQRWPESWEGFLERCSQVQDPYDWKLAYTEKITEWAEWFWPQFESQWLENVTSLQGERANHHEIRITRITSLAYDETGKVYEVPLVIGALTPEPESEGPQSEQVQGIEGAPGRGYGDAAAPPRPAGAGGSVGLD